MTARVKENFNLRNIIATTVLINLAKGRGMCGVSRFLIKKLFKSEAESSTQTNPKFGQISKIKHLIN
jgi:hypothetical protein